PRTVYQFPKPTWIENIIATRSGSLLVTLINPGEVHLVDPSANTSSLVHAFAEQNATLGITEYAPDVFAVVAGNFTYADVTTEAGSWSIWSLDVRNGTSQPLVSKIVDVPASQLLNGLAALDATTLFVADSGLGHILQVDIAAGTYRVALDHPSMKVVPGKAFGLGVNGLKVNGGYVYYTNSGANSLTRVPVDNTGAVVGAYETLASNYTALADDIGVTDDGAVFSNDEANNRVLRVEPNGHIEVIAGGLNSSVIPNPTSLTLGRTWHDRNFVYVGTTGGVGAPINGTFTEGAKVVAVQI
ncbi:hypothetical protein K491DRAFT_583606, partial [Lophiostoma macrostomum CBS 122681]